MQPKNHKNCCHRFYSAVFFILVLCFIPACKDGGISIPGVNNGTPGDTYTGDQGSYFHFEIRTPYLYPAWTDPAGLSWDVPINTSISVNYYVPIDPLTVTPGTLIVTDPGNNPVAGSLFVSANTITFTPSDRLAPQTLYSVAVTTGVRPADGTEFLEPLLWSFTTGTTVQPSVLSTMPLPDEQGVPTNATLSVIFRTEVDPQTVTPSTFYVMDPGNNPVSGSILVSGNTLTFTPDVYLAGQTIYTATVTTGILASYGGPFMEPLSWTFTTGLSRDMIVPQVIASTPAAGAQDVPTDTPVQITLSEPLVASVYNTGFEAYFEDGNGSGFYGSTYYDEQQRTVTAIPPFSLMPGTDYMVKFTITFCEYLCYSQDFHFGSFRTAGTAP